MKYVTRNSHRVILFLALTSGGIQTGLAQGSFGNLSFEAARNVPTFDPAAHPWTMSAADALPDWSCFVGMEPVSFVFYSDVALDSASIALLPSDTPIFPAPDGVIDGRYSILLQSGYGQQGQNTPVSISQVGQIPFDAKSIRFRATGPLLVSFDGNALPLLQLDSRDGATIYGSDLTIFAGQSGDLRFTSQTRFDHLDGIVFSTVAIPEPSAGILLLGGLGILWIGGREWFRAGNP